MACEARPGAARLWAVSIVRSLRSFLIASSLAASLMQAGACSNKAEEADAKPSTLPALSFRADTPSLMLTWIDDRGGTHVVASPEKIPDPSRDFVRVVVSDRPEGTTDPIYVSDLSKPGADGSFSTRTVARSVWEDEIERRREKNAEAALEPRPEAPEPRRPREPAAPPVDPPARPGPDRQPDKHDEGPTDGKSHITATVYGADWCTPCHQALDHLKRRGVRATFKNIEKDGAAQAEMAAKLKRIGRADGRIPVIDIDGKILVGFSARAIDQALDRAGSGTML